MATALSDVLRFIRRAAAHAAGPTDGELLSRFAAVRDEGAFAALLGRHGPLVLAVCRRLLPSEQDAEDAFQATFLVLVCKAGAVASRESVGSWLYGVAYRTATKARRASARRRRREAGAAGPPHPAAPQAEPQDWEALYAELERLPEKYRAALVLCDLEGSSRQGAAAALGIPEGTLSSRLAAARRMLGDRLARRGFVLAAGALAASSAVPGALAASTTSMAALVAAGQLWAVEASAAFLAKGVMRAMVMTKVKFALAAAVAIGLVTGGVSLRWGPPAAEAQSPSPPAKASAKPASELEALRQEVELLKVNQRLLLEKVVRQEAELAALRGAARPGASPLTRHPKSPSSILPHTDAKDPTTTEARPGRETAPAGLAPEPEPGAVPRGQLGLAPSAAPAPRNSPSAAGPAREDLPEIRETPAPRAAGDRPAERARVNKKAREALERTIETLRRQLKDLDGDSPPPR